MYHTYPVTLNDVDDIAALDQELFPDNFYNEKTVETEITLGSGWVVRTDDGQLAGYALLRCDEGLYDLIKLGVRVGHRERGIGSSLLSYAIRKGDLMLTVDPKNKVALRLYLSRGLQIVGRLVDGEGLILRRKSTSACA